VPLTRKSAIFDRRFVRHLWELTRIYWTSPDAPKGAALLALCVAGELGTVYGNVRLAMAQSHVFDAVQNKELPAFLAAIEVFLGVALLVVFVSTYRIYLRNILQIRWREHVTDHFLGDWMGPHAYCQRELHHAETDNPDQRIAEDIQSYVASALGLSLSLLSAVATLISFSGMLWTLSGKWPLRIGATELWIPGLMMWVAILYALVATWLTNRVGRSLASINFDRLRFEADFRYGLVRFRDHVEAVALSRGEAVERQGALARFHQVVGNWWELIGAQRNLTLLTSGIGQANGIVPLLVAAPAFFAGRMTLGSVTETGIAYGQVSGALSWFVDAYQEIASWRASIERLATFAEVLDLTRDELARGDGIRVEPVEAKSLRLVHLGLSLPADKTPLVSDLNETVEAGERVAFLGPAGVVKTALFRAIAGIWPFGHGTIEMPARARPLFFPQQAYMPIGTLRQAVSYPAPAGTFADERIRTSLARVELPQLADRLDESATWEQKLSGDEQQRLTFARALLHEPDWIVMDDATAMLDEAMEQRMYAMLAEQLPRTAVVSITNRPGVAAYHQRRWDIAPAPPPAATGTPA
jgi:putative ATP-binding cassette transporter